MNGVEKKLINIKEKKPTVHDDLYKDHKNWGKKVKKPKSFNIYPKNSKFQDL